MKIKSAFKSRWGNEGCLIEADWSGLELIGWAFLTKDPELYRLINSGQDMHRFVGSKVLGCKPEDISDEQRKKLKPANFTLVYGGTDWNLVNKDGLDPAFAKQVYETFWSLFPVARLWSDNLMKLLDANVFTNKDGETWSWYRGITGRKFFFKAYKDKISAFCSENRIYTPGGFKYSEGMNYQVQSFCTADIHMIALGNLWRKSIEHRDKFLLINTIHDSVLIDCKKEFVESTGHLVKNSLEYVVTVLKEKFNIIFDLPLTVDLKSGDNWAEMEKLSLSRVNNLVV